MNATEDNVDDVDELLNISQIIYITFGLTILVLGTIGNLLDIVSFVRLECLKTLASSQFLLASFFGSEIMLITGILLPIIQGFITLNTFIGATIICKIRWYFRTVSGTFSLACVCFAAIDRYLVSCIDIRRHRLITLTRARWIIFCIASFWLIVLSPYGLYYTASNQKDCAIINPVFAYFAPYFNLFHYSILPLSILSILCVLTWENLGKQQAIYLRGTRLYDQITRMIIGQILVIFFTSIPNMIWQIYIVSTNSTSKSTLRQAQEDLIGNVCILIGYLTHAMPFYVYWMASVTFRQNIKALLLHVH
ncbi:unnamed protein product [Rotaria sordida]|uniref:G-protein coupled receptors family 1 profile domain-containing protein n=1 Tax=Rotaria sordida TaxID=392033 RepID=A0A814YRA2_9BILA|nr:unnamed protein product [Rotaria sordida]